MGYTHYWYRIKEIDKRTFSKIVEDFKKFLPLFKTLDIKLGDGSGKGEPIINHDAIIFNGLHNCGHPQNKHISIPWPASKTKNGVAPSSQKAIVGGWFAGVVLEQRTCDGDCAYETFYFPRILKLIDPQKGDRSELIHCYQFSDEKDTKNKKHFSFCKTAFRPYDLAVNVFLIIAKHHMGNSIKVKSDGELQHWMDAAKICQNALGYGLNDFKLE